MRTNACVEVGQVWRSSDPRRLSAFKIEAVVEDADVVRIITIYPHDRWFRAIDRVAFQTTGPKGYTRMS